MDDSSEAENYNGKGSCIEWSCPLILPNSSDSSEKRTGGDPIVCEGTTGSCEDTSYCQGQVTWSEGEDTSPEHSRLSGHTKESRPEKAAAVFDMADDFAEELNFLHEMPDEPTQADPQTEERSKRLCAYIFRDTLGYDFLFPGPFGNNFLTYLDYIASGRPLKCIENYIRAHVLPVYANTHTEVSFTAQQTTLFRQEARNIIREAVNASEDDAVIFTGSGATSAINKLAHALNLKDPLVFIGPYEHHSNMLPWLDMKAQVVKIPQTKDGLVDLQRLHWEIHSRYHRAKPRTIIGSFSAASNITGILTDVNAITAILHKFNGMVFFDYACAAPYVEIDMNPESKSGPHGFLYIDAIFISPHKFIGGPGTPGILVAKRHLFKHPIPHNTGGGTVNFVRRTAHRYNVDPENREEGGTPAIIESIRAGLVFKLKQAITAEFIMDKEELFYRRARQVWSQTPDLVILGNQQATRLPIFPMMFYNPQSGRFLHHNFVAVLLNDVFGIQVRAGCACAGPYGMDLMGMDENLAKRLETFTGRPPKVHKGEKMPNEPFSNNLFKPGFVRLNIPYFISEECFHFVLSAINMTARRAWALMPQYEFDRTSGNWWHKKLKDNKERLSFVNFATGSLQITRPSNLQTGQASMDSSCTGDTPLPINYTEILERAECIFSDAVSGIADQEDQTDGFLGEADVLRWFMLPSEAADIIHQRRVSRLVPDELPFLPGALARKLGIQVKGHKGRRALDKRFPVEYN